MKLLRRYREGVTTTEYGIIVSLVWVMVFAVFASMKIYGWGLDLDFDQAGGEGRATLAASLPEPEDSAMTSDDAPPAEEPPAEEPPAEEPPAGEPPAEDPPAEPTPPPFTINPNGSLTIAVGSATPQIAVLGSAIQYGAGGPQCPVSISTTVNGVTTQLFKGTGSQVDPTTVSSLGGLPGGTTIDFIGKSYNPYNGSTLYTMKTSSSSPMIIPLRNGDYVPDKTPYSQQPEIKSFLSSVIDPVTKKVTIADNQVLYLMELGTTNSSSPAADFQDLVFLVTM